MAELTDSDQLSANNDKFTRSLYSAIRSQPGNLFFSPISIEIVLGMVHAGADGETARQLEAATGLSSSKETVAKNFATLIESLNSLDQNVTLKLANAMYGQEGFQFNPEFTNTVQKDFNAEANLIDFKDSIGAVGTINNWVNDKTGGKIPKLFEEGSLDATTKLVLLNAIFFKGSWLHQFKPEETHKGLFHLDTKNTQEVDFMKAKKSWRYSFRDDLNAHVVELPYEGKAVSMVLVVPTEIDGLAHVENSLSTIELRHLNRKGLNREVVLTMPKFKLEQTHDVKDILSKLGITDLFSERSANLSGISSEPLFVSKAVQKAMIEVNEEGATAAAATGLRVTLRMMPPQPIEINVKSPFYFCIQTREEPFVTLFQGRVSAPVY